MNYARKVDPIKSGDLFQKSWLKIRERELREPNWKASHYKTYFYSVLNSVKLDELRKDSRNPITLSQAPETIDTIYDDAWEVESQILHKWLQARVDDDYLRMLKQIADLTIRCKTIKDAQRRVEISERSFFKYLAEAKKEIDYEHFLLTDCHPLSESDMVRRS